MVNKKVSAVILEGKGKVMSARSGRLWCRASPVSFQPHFQTVLAVFHKRSSGDLVAIPAHCQRDSLLCDWP